MVLGLTGGVGSGKSTVTGHLSGKYGFHLLSTDNMARELEEPGRAAYTALVREFGDSILTGGSGDDIPADGSGEQRPIDKMKFAALIYSDPEALRTVNEIVHPLTWDEVEESIRRLRAEHPGADIAVETALPSPRFREMCDEVWFVLTNPEVRIERLMLSRGYTREKCESIIDSQLSDEEFILYADYIVDNSGGAEETTARVDELLAGHTN